MNDLGKVIVAGLLLMMMLMVWLMLLPAPCHESIDRSVCDIGATMTFEYGHNFCRCPSGVPDAP
jgi:hypothetical protein